MTEKNKSLTAKEGFLRFDETGVGEAVSRLLDGRERLGYNEASKWPGAAGFPGGPLLA